MTGVGNYSCHATTRMRQQIVFDETAIGAWKYFVDKTDKNQTC